MGFQFPDPALPGRPMKASNLNDLRNTINRARENAGLAPVSWGPDVNPGDPIRASHMTEIRDQIRSLWLTKDIINQSSQFPAFDAGEPVAFKAVPALDVNDTRAWTNQGQDNPTRQGISTLAHDPANSQTRVTSEWVADIRAMQLTEAKRIRAVRCVVGKNGPQSAPTPAQVAKYTDDFNKYRNPGTDLPGYRVFVVLNKQTFDNGQPVNEGLGNVGTVPYTNPYIEGYAPAMVKLMEDFYVDASVADFIIWNEPNDLNPNKKMTADVFAALLRRTWLAARANPVLGPRMLGYYSGFHRC